MVANLLTNTYLSMFDYQERNYGFFQITDFAASSSLDAMEVFFSQ